MPQHSGKANDKSGLFFVCECRSQRRLCVGVVVGVEQTALGHQLLTWLLIYLQIGHFLWRARQDSNLRPAD